MSDTFYVLQEFFSFLKTVYFNNNGEQNDWTSKVSFFLIPSIPSHHGLILKTTRTCSIKLIVKTKGAFIGGQCRRMSNKKVMQKTEVDSFLKLTNFSSWLISHVRLSEWRTRVDTTKPNSWMSSEASVGELSKHANASPCQEAVAAKSRNQWPKG